MPQPRAAMIINARARRASSALRARAVRALARSHAVTTMVTERSGDGTRLARRAVERGVDLVVTMGGDGTVNEVATGLEDGGVPLLALPLGGTNVFTRALGWPKSPDDAISLLERSTDGSLPEAELRVWAAQAGGSRRLICINAGMGIDAEAVALVEAHPGAKRRLGQASFAVAAARSAHAAVRRGGVLEVRSDDRDPVALMSLSAALGGPYAYLGSLPLDLVPGADFDGTLRWVGMSPGTLVDVARIAGGALAAARHVGDRRLVEGRAVRELTVRSSVPVDLQVDGEPLGAHSEVTFAPAGLLRAVRAPSR
jgi:diacylglycerol kinase family enzyme